MVFPTRREDPVELVPVPLDVLFPLSAKSRPPVKPAPLPDYSHLVDPVRRRPRHPETDVVAMLTTEWEITRTVCERWGKNWRVTRDALEQAVKAGRVQRKVRRSGGYTGQTVWYRRAQ